VQRRAALPKVRAVVAIVSIGWLIAKTVHKVVDKVLERCACRKPHPSW
jgi:hypothetical protein